MLRFVVIALALVASLGSALATTIITYPKPDVVKQAEAITLSCNTSGHSEIAYTAPTGRTVLLAHARLVTADGKPLASSYSFEARARVTGDRNGVIASGSAKSPNFPDCSTPVRLTLEVDITLDPK